MRTNPDGSIGAVGATTLHLLPGRLPWGVRRVGRARRAPPVGRPRRRGAERHHRQDGRVGWGDSGVRRRRRGLFHGIAARYLADTAVRRPELAPLATKIVLATAEAAWQGRMEVAGGPVFAQDWRRSARTPDHGVPEAISRCSCRDGCSWAAARAAGAATTQQGTRPGLTLPSTAGVESIARPRA